MPAGSMSLCPVDFRYGRREMKSLFSEGARLQRLLDVEAGLSEAHAKVGKVPRKDAAEIRRRANTRTVRLARVRQIDRKIGHDIMAVVQALSEKCSASARRSVHLGATSNDILDTATALQLRGALEILEGDLLELRAAFVRLARRYRDTIMLGRTHGQAAVPITFGLKMAVFAEETDRHLRRLREARPRVVVGKLSGAVGTGAALGPKALRIQREFGKILDLEMEEASTQIVGRDRYAELVAILAGIASSLEKFATEVRNLQRTEIAEAAEAFETKRQVGSSTMAQKQNPVTSENVCGLARIVRAFAIPAFENVPLWHERDLTNSAAERIILPHALILTDDILVKTARVFRTLRVDARRMRANLEATGGQIMAESVMIALVGKGMGRQDAHELLRTLSIRARQERVPLRDVLLEESEVRRRLSELEVDRALDPMAYTGAAGAIVDRVVAKYAAAKGR